MNHSFETLTMGTCVGISNELQIIKTRNYSPPNGNSANIFELNQTVAFNLLKSQNSFKIRWLNFVEKKFIRSKHEIMYNNNEDSKNIFDLSIRH